MPELFILPHLRSQYRILPQLLSRGRDPQQYLPNLPFFSVFQPDHFHLPELRLFMPKLWRPGGGQLPELFLRGRFKWEQMRGLPGWNCF